MSLFETGTIVNTMGIREIMQSSTEAMNTIQRCLRRHMNGDWGDLCDEDKKMNDESLEIEKSGGWADRLFSSYNTDFGKIYIITEYDRSVTTILLPEEY